MQCYIDIYDLFVHFAVVLADARWGWVVNANFRPLYLLERDPVPIIKEAGCAPGRSGKVRKTSPPPTGFNLRNVQPVVSVYPGPIYLHITPYQLREILSEVHYCNYLFVILIELLSHVHSFQNPGVETGCLLYPHIT
jgi:hypothetical protein